MKCSLVVLLAVAVNAWSPTDSYAPGKISCPDYLDDSSYKSGSKRGLIRAADNVSSSESSWMDERSKVVNKNLRTFLKDAKMTDFDVDKFMDQLSTLAGKNSSVVETPRIGLAFSGGGYRAMITAAGEISGLDNRTRGTAEHGLPILGAASYIAGLSGGSWFLSTLAMNNWTAVQEIVDKAGQDDSIWDLRHNLLDPDGINIFKTGSYLNEMDDQLDDKKNAGFNISLTDPWGRGLSHQFFPGLKDFGAGMTFSSLRDFPVFKNHSMPFPLIVSDGRRPGTSIVDLNSTVFEINPYEIGSWDPTLYSFADLKYTGTDVKEGFPTNGTCIGGFDNAGYVFGTSSTLFNQGLLRLNSTGITGTLYNLLHSFLNDLSNDEDDIAEWRPNPFYQSPWGDSDNLKNNKSLYLVDGGEDGQNVPLQPLLQPERQIDTIFAFDNSYDTDYVWPNGQSLVQTYRRQFAGQANGTSFPYVPDMNTFLNLNLTAKPTFFGCYAKNLTSLMNDVGADRAPPLVIYTANRPFTYNSNTSTYKMSYKTKDMLSIIQNGFAVSTRKNLTLDDEWNACVGCAVLQRSRERLGLSMGDQCKKCFDKYCWDGSLDPTLKNIPDSFNDEGVYNSSVANGTSSSSSASANTASSTRASKGMAPSGMIATGGKGALTAMLVSLLFAL